MGGYGSGRPATRPTAENAFAWPVHLVADALAELRRRRDAGEHVSHLPGRIGWTSTSTRREAGSASYTVAEQDGQPWALLAYTANDEPHAERIDLVEVPSNLGRGQLVYWRCPCGQRARVLYYTSRVRGWRCRRCSPVTYQSSRDSDRRVSDFLAGGGLTDLDGATPTMLFTALKAIDRQRAYHAGQGRPWSPARRAAQRRREDG